MPTPHRTRHGGSGGWGPAEGPIAISSGAGWACCPALNMTQSGPAASLSLEKCLLYDFQSRPFMYVTDTCGLPLWSPPTPASHPRQLGGHACILLHTGTNLDKNKTLLSAIS